MRHGHWCGTIRGAGIALSAAGLIACSGSAYELGHEAGGAAGAGTDGDGTVGGSSGKAGSAGKGASGGTGGSVNGTGGDATGSGGVATGGSAGTVDNAAGSPIDATGGTATGTGATGTGGSGTVDAAVSELRRDVTKLDLLFMVDGSIGMAEKQARLAKAVPLLLKRLTNPWCVVGGNHVTVAADADGNCSQGKLEFQPIRDIHVGVISSSLGDRGSGDVCSDAQNAANGNVNFYNDRAQLIPSVRPNLGDQDFLSWGAGSTDPDGFATDTAAELTAVDEKGCGYEAQLESWYRFLVDPSPIVSTTNDKENSVRGAVNTVVLDERARFLRTDSAVMIVMLSDENDCSIMDENGSQGWLVGYKGGVTTDNWHMPRATSACASDPEDPCCRPCGSGLPLADGCPADDQDAACRQSTVLSQAEDSMNLRCFKQKQRFGVDLLYPTSRYSNALQAPLIDPRMTGQMVPNPLFTPGADGTPPRDRSLVFLTGIVGVPWQDVAREDSSAADQPLEFLEGADLETTARWQVILGDPDNGVPPTDPFMLESIDPRKTGATDPVGGTAITAPASTSLNPINGHEQDVLADRDDLQFACIYPREPALSPEDCSANPDVCDCNADEFEKHSPLCDGVTATTDGSQLFDKAYPALRELAVLKTLGGNGLVTSICPKSTTTDDAATDLAYGLNPAVRAIGDTLANVFTQKCLPRSLPLDSGNQTTARVYEARPNHPDCSCDAAQGRLDLDDASMAHLPGIEQQLRNAGIDPAGECVCEITQLAGDAGDSCRNDGTPASELRGFCYLDPSSGLGEASLVAGCAGQEHERIRFVGDNVPASNAMTFLVLPYDPTSR
jgi:hypothetical protein